MSPSAALSDSTHSSARSLLDAVLSHLTPRTFAVELWNGEFWPADSAKPAFKLIFRSPEVVRAMFSHPSALSFGEAYIYGYLDVEGSLLDVFKSGERLLTVDLSWMEKLQMARRLWSIPVPDYPRGSVFGGFRRHFVSAGERLRAAVNYHYDHPVIFGGSGWVSRCTTAAHTSNRPDFLWAKHRNAKSTTFAASSGSSPGSACSISVAAGARSSSMLRPIKA